MPNLSNAIVLATTSHEGQVDKIGVTYILHPLGVMQRALKTWGYDEHLLMTAVLHDVVEDTKVTLEHLRSLDYPPEVVEAVKYLSKRKEEEDAEGDSPEEKERKYSSFIQRVSQGPLIARRIKVADLWDNSDPRRQIDRPTKNDLERQAKYKRALGVLTPLT